MAFTPSPHYVDSIHSDPLYRKTVRSIHPVEAAGIITPQSYTGRRGHTTRYVIVNEHDPRKKLLRSTTRIPRHYLMEEPTEILELYPRNARRYVTRPFHHQPHPHRSHPSQQHLSEEEEGEQAKSNKRKTSLGKSHRPQSLSNLHLPAHFFIGDCVESHVNVAKESQGALGRYRTQDEEEDRQLELVWGDSKSRFRSQGFVAEPPSVRAKRRIHSPGRQCPSTARIRNTASHVEPKTRTKQDVLLTESDSASLASSSDQQNSSTDQYIQVIHSKERCFKSDARQGKLAKKKSKTSFDVNTSESNDLVCSNV